jgi:hypothetical protein
LFVKIHCDAQPQRFALQAFDDEVPEGTVWMGAARLIIFASHKSAGGTPFHAPPYTRRLDKCSPTTVRERAPAALSAGGDAFIFFSAAPVAQMDRAAAF